MPSTPSTSTVRLIKHTAKAKAKPTRSKAKPPGSEFIDDEAIESDDGLSDDSSDLSDLPEGIDTSMDTFIVPDEAAPKQQRNRGKKSGLSGSKDQVMQPTQDVSMPNADGDPSQTDTLSENSQAPDIGPSGEEPVTPRKRKAPGRARKWQQINTDDEEDLTTMTKDDSMFNRPSTKTSLLPPPILTRSSRRVEPQSSSPIEVLESPSKKPRLDDATETSTLTNAVVPVVPVSTPSNASSPKDVTSTAAQISPGPAEANNGNVSAPTSTPQHELAPAGPQVTEDSMKSYLQGLMKDQTALVLETVLQQLMPVVTSIQTAVTANSLAVLAPSTGSTMATSQAPALPTPADPSPTSTSLTQDAYSADTVQSSSTVDRKGKGKAIDIPDAFSMFPEEGEATAEQGETTAEPQDDAAIPWAPSPEPTWSLPSSSTTTAAAAPTGTASATGSSSTTTTQTAPPPTSTSATELSTDVKPLADDLMESLHMFAEGPGTSIKAEDGDDQNPAIPVSDLFLEDLETYRTDFNPLVQCKVFDLELQDPLIRFSYKNLPPLTPKPVLAAYSAEGEIVAVPGETGGRCCFSRWPENVSNITRKTIYGAITFKRHGVYINPARISPVDVAIRPTATGSTSLRINVTEDHRTKVAICVTPGMCQESFLTEPVFTRAKVVKMHKYLTVLFHDQEWERWEAFMCLVFASQFLYCKITDLAVQFGTTFVIAGAADNAQSSPVKSKIQDNMRSPARARQGTAAQPPAAATQYSLKYSLAPTDPVPVYNAVGRDFDFDTQLPVMASVLPRYKGEIPQGSFVVVGYSVSTYKNAIRGKSGPQDHVGCNLMWVILCGTPNV